MKVLGTYHNNIKRKEHIKITHEHLCQIMNKILIFQA